MAILSTELLMKVTRGFAGDPAPEQARVLSGSLAGMRIVNVYVVNGVAVGASQYDLKVRWLGALSAWLCYQHDPADPLLVLGDFNVTPEDAEVHDPQRWHGLNLASEPERERIRGLSDRAGAKVPAAAVSSAPVTTPGPL